MKNHYTKLNSIFLLLGLMFIAACSYEPVPIEIGKDVCEHCKMTIVDPKWGAELITKKGKIYKYDVIECLILHSKTFDKNSIHSAWTINYLNNKQFIEVENAIYLRNKEISSPMGINAISLSNKNEIQKLNFKSSTEPFDWNKLLKIVDSEFSE